MLPSLFLCGCCSGGPRALPCYHAGLALVATRRCSPFIWTLRGPRTRPLGAGGGGLLGGAPPHYIPATTHLGCQYDPRDVNTTLPSPCTLHKTNTTQTNAAQQMASEWQSAATMEWAGHERGSPRVWHPQRTGNTAKARAKGTNLNPSTRTSHVYFLRDDEQMGEQW